MRVALLALLLASSPLLAAAAASPAAPAPPCQAGPAVATVGGHRVHQARGGPVVFQSGLAVDVDGAPGAVHPEGRGLDALANAGRPGRWWGVATDTGEPDGQPIVQGPQAPRPGFYVSTTSLQDVRFGRADPRRYVDATTVPYVVLPADRRLLRRLGVRLGDLAVVTARGRRGPVQVAAILADLGPKDQLGEGSVALARALGLPADPRRGGAPRGVTTVIFPGSGAGRPLPLGTLRARAAAALARWGGQERLAACAAARL